MLNYAGLKPDLLPYVCDAAPSKQGKFLSGSHIPNYTSQHPNIPTQYDFYAQTRHGSDSPLEYPD
ncbi:hypothetical protein CCP3SC15_1750002 [Gammaproteobacteria bacterium]